MKRSYLLLWLGLVLVGLVAAGCGGGAVGPVKVEVPDFYSPSISGTTYSPKPPVAGTDLVITVSATDNGGAPTVTLNYRRIGTTDFTSINPTSSLSNLYTFTIPGAQVASPGIEYYMKATDGTNVTNDPASAPTSLYTIPINYVFITHNAITGVKALSQVFISATLTSDTAITMAQSGFAWREVGAAAFTSIPFDTKNGDIYTGSIAANLLQDGKVYEYYVYGQSAGGAQQQYPANAVTSATFLKFNASNSINNKPVARPQVATASTLLTVGAEIQLEAQYVDSDGPGPYSYKWTRETNNPLELSTYDSAVTTFTAITPGNYTFILEVSDGQATSEPTPITVAVSAPTLAGTLGDVILRRASSPYTVTGDVTVQAGATMKIEPGVIVRFKSDTRMTILGTLDANGSASSPITFTSDTTLQIKGYWRGLYLSNTPRLPVSTINFCIVQYSRDGIVLTNADSPTISECVIKLNDIQGIYCDNSTVTINKNQIEQNGTYGVYCVNNSFATISSNVIKQNNHTGVYCSQSKVEMAKNEVTENKYGTFIVNCRGANVVNVFGNKFFANTDGIRVEDSNPVIQANDIYVNKDNGIIAYTTQAGITAGNFSSPNITSNGIHNNRDDGIHLEYCYPAAPRAWNDAQDQFEIYSNVIGFSGGEAIECKGSSPIINANIIGMSSDNGILVLAGTDYGLTRASSPFMKMNDFLSNARAAVAVLNDVASGVGGICAPEAWWNNFSYNNLVWIDLQNAPGVDLASTVGMDIGSVPVVTAYDNDSDGVNDIVVVQDTSYASGGHTYYLYLGLAAPVTGTRFGWNYSVDPLFDHGSVNAAKWEDPFTTTWALRSDDSNPRNALRDNVVFVKNSPTSDLLNSGWPVSTFANTPANVRPQGFDVNGNVAAGNPGGALINLPSAFISDGAGGYQRDPSGNWILATIGYANYQNVNLNLMKWIGTAWPTK